MIGTPHGPSRRPEQQPHRNYEAKTAAARPAGLRSATVLCRHSTPMPQYDIAVRLINEEGISLESSRAERLGRIFVPRARRCSEVRETWRRVAAASLTSGYSLPPGALSRRGRPVHYDTAACGSGCKHTGGATAATHRFGYRDEAVATEDLQSAGHPDCRSNLDLRVER